MASGVLAAEQSSPEVFSWLKTLPLAPEYHPTTQEFQDPIAYIFKIEKEASQYGICKIVPPVPPMSKKSVITHLNRSLAARASKSDPKSPPSFTTRQQQIGFCPRKQRPIQKAVWQSGQHYTPQEFEAKARNFEKSYLKNRAKKTLSPLEIETLYWKANGDRPFSVEYANDMPGSAFGPVKDRKREFGEAGSGAVTVGETAWNMRGISRAYGSLLKFMKEEIAGVTSPMVYIAMMFSWFAWHVEDHDLHSLNYLHFGAGKTWYGVPRDAAVAFEEVVRVYGYGEEINPLATFAVLGEKTTVMSPEVLVNAGVPCCRLVQNAGEFVVTFPRAYHSGFSHGFNCGEASNIATPEWLRFAKDAAIRRASINYPPMVSHFQLLYDLALGICSRGPMSGHVEPRSSRLRDKKKGEGETLVKQLFVQDVQQNNDLLHILGKGTPIVLLPQNPTEKFISSTLFVGSKYKAKPRVSLGLCSEAATAEAIMLVRNEVGKQLNTFYPVKAKFSSIGQKGEFASHGNTDEARFCDSGTENEASTVHGGLSSRGLFSCVKCGIWPFACVAIVQPTDAAARHFMSANGNFFNDWSASTELCTDGNITADGDGNTSEPDSTSGSLRKSIPDGLYDVPIQSADYQIPAVEHSTDFVHSSDCQLQKVDNAYLEASDSKTQKGPSALGLLASVYGNSSDSDEDDIPVDNVVHASNIASKDGSWQNKCHYDDSGSPSSHQDPYSSARWGRSLSSSDYEGEDEVIVEKDSLYGVQGSAKVPAECRTHGTYDCAVEFAGDNLINNGTYSSSTPYEQSVAKFSSSIVTTENPNAHFAQGLDEDSSRMHVFCLEHAAEVEQQLKQFGGVRTLLLCHPDYPKVEAAAKQLSEEFEVHYDWKGTSFSDPTKEDEEKIQLALENEELTPKNGDWTVKLGINLYYSAILCRSPLYSKQMPYNSVIYSAFGRTAPSSSPVGLDLHVRGPGRQKKIVLAGKWCGKVWMSNQVHPLLVQRDTEDEEEERAFEIQLKANEKHGRKSESNCITVSTLLPKKSRRERKGKVASRPTKKLKSQESEVAYSDSDDSVDVGSHQGRKRSIGKMKVGSKSAKGLKLQDPESADDSDPQDSADSDSHEGYGRNARNKLFTGTFQPRGNSRRITVQYSDDEIDGGPSSRLRKRMSKDPSDSETKPMLKKQLRTSKGRRGPVTKGPAMRFPLVKGPATKGPAVRSPAMKGSAIRSPAMKGPAASSSSSKGGLSVRTTAMKGLAKCSDPKVDEEELEYVCDVEGCNMSFDSKQELSLHKRNICPVDGCGKKFFSHKYLVQHRRVHADERPLKCPWKGCRMTFKWAWARTEHIRVHTGARPYVCNEPGCGQTFRFVSDFSRHKRKTGHSAKKAKR